MNFSSLEFIFLFLPLFLAVYYIMPPKLRNGVLFLGSLVFYAVGTYKTPAFLMIIAVSTVINYILGVLIDIFPRRRGYFVLFGTLWNIGSLFLFKYAKPLFGGLGNILSSLLRAEVTFNISALILPMGLSFFAFRAVAYLVDVSRGEVPAERSPLNFAVFMCMFPCMVAGPITSYRKLRNELIRRSYSIDGFCTGARTFIIGLALKVLIADRLSACFTRVSGIGYDSITTPLAWIALIAYSIYIYFDFYGYSLMAVGLGRMLGFSLPENFRDPYLALGMADFWRRWHITLGEWFKRYIYIPLGGNRYGNTRTLINLLAVWIFTGMWHGATLNFIIWGLLLFVLVAAEKFIYGGYLSAHPLAGHIYMAVTIPLSWAVFAITDLSKLGVFFTRLFPFLPHGEVFAVRGDFIEYLTKYGICIILGIILITPYPRRIAEKLNKTLVGDILLTVAIILSVYFLCQSAGDPFMYGNF